MSNLVKGCVFVEFLRKLLEIMDADMAVPQMYGWFHLTFFALSIIVAILLCKFRPNGEERFVRRLLIVTSVIVIALEIYKQINFSFSYQDAIVFDYQW